LGGILAAALAKIKARNKVCKDACRKMSDKSTCFKKCKIDQIKGEISIYQSNMSKCDKTKNPEKCKAYLEKKIKKAKVQLAKAK